MTFLSKPMTNEQHDVTAPSSPFQEESGMRVLFSIARPHIVLACRGLNMRRPVPVPS